MPLGCRWVVNARIDGLARRRDDTAVLADVIARGNAYAAAGADCVFVLGAMRPGTIATLVAEIDAPLNVLGTSGSPPIPVLQDLGVARVSVGPLMAEAAMGLLKRGVEEMRVSGSYRFAEGAMSYSEIQALFTNQDR